MRTQIMILTSYTRQLEGTTKNNARILDRQVILKNELIARRARKEAAQGNGHKGTQPEPESQN